MRKLLIYTALAFASAVTSMPLAVAPASAQNFELEIGRDGPNIRVRPNCDPDFEDCRYERREYRHNARREGCTEERALRKAERMGIRRARVVDVDPRTIDVRGRNRAGDRVAVTFGRRDRSCPVW